MRDNRTSDIDMRLDGSFVDPPRVPLWLRLFRVALVIAVLAVATAGAALLLGFALFMIPVAIGASLVAWGAWRFRLWQAGGSVRHRQ